MAARRRRHAPATANANGGVQKAEETHPDMRAIGEVRDDDDAQLDHDRETTADERANPDGE